MEEVSLETKQGSDYLSLMDYGIKWWDGFK